MIEERRFGDHPVLVEEFLLGDELSVLALCDGERALPLAPARDFKRIGDGDTGPNTGGMGAFSPVAEIGPELLDEIVATVHQPVLDELRERGTPFHGVLYAGLMLTDDGPRVLEFNVRFGDPETQVVLPRLRSDLLDLLDPRDRARRPGRRRARVGRARGRHRRARLRGLPGVLLLGRRDLRPRPRPGRRRGHARGHRRGGRRGGHRGRPRAQRHRARARRRAPPGRPRMLPPT